MRDSLKPITTGSGLILLLAALMVQMSQAPGRILLSLADATAGATLLALRLVIGRWPVPLRWAHAVAAAVGGVGLSICLATMHFMQDPQQTISFMLLIITAGLLLLSTRWLLLVILATLIAWGLMAWWARPSPLWPTFGFALLVAVKLALVTHIIRRQMLLRLETLRLQDQAQKEEIHKLNENLEQRVMERTATLRAREAQLRALSTHLQSLREQERVVIARDLHDELGQALTSLKMDLSMLERKVKNANGKSAAAILNDLAMMQKLVVTTINEVRSLITKLRPEVLDTLGLVPALEWQLDEFRKRTGLACEFHSEPEELNLAKEHALAVFRIFQESLTNIARHAAASRVKAKIEKRDHALWIEIADDGKGITPEELNAPGKLGLLGMHERALVFGGEVSIAGAPGQGTTVKIKVPIPG